MENLFNEKKMQLMSGCYGTEVMVYRKNMTEEELLQHKNEYVTAAIKKAKLEEEFKKLQDEFKNNLKPLAELQKEHLNILRVRSKEVEGTLYMFDDQERRVMNYVDENGELVMTRPLTQKERQLNFVSEAAKETQAV